MAEVLRPRQAPITQAPEWRPRKPVNPEQPAGFPIDDPTGPCAKTALANLDNWREKAKYVAELRARVAERKGEVEELEMRYRSTVTYDLEQGRALLAEIQAFGPELDVWRERINEAVLVAEDASTEYYAFVDGHWRELLQELAPDAQRVHEEYISELAAVRERLASLVGERTRIATAVRSILSGTRPFVATDVPDDPEQLPLPTDDAWRRYHAANPTLPTASDSSLAEDEGSEDLTTSNSQYPVTA